jgi:peptide-methionine (S)-S-oxide reductase
MVDTPARVPVGDTSLLQRFARAVLAEIDPTEAGGQFYDRGSQHYTAIFHLSERQRLLAKASKTALDESGVLDKPAATQILPAKPFYIARTCHQDCFLNYVSQYERYATGSGRKACLEETREDLEGISLGGEQDESGEAE